MDSQSKEKARLPYFGERMAFSSCERPLCRRRRSKKIITSDHGGFTGGQTPTRQPTPASIRSPELKVDLLQFQNKVLNLLCNLVKFYVLRLFYVFHIIGPKYLIDCFIVLDVFDYEQPVFKQLFINYTSIPEHPCILKRGIAQIDCWTIRITQH